MEPMKNILMRVAIVLAMGSITQMSQAGNFEFDRPGDGFSTSVVPKGHFALELALPDASYDERRDDGVDYSTVTVQGRILERIGVGANTELRIGWDGPIWQKQKVDMYEDEEHGKGDVVVGIKKAIDTQDDNFTWALLAQAKLSTSDDDFSIDDDIYTLGSSISYKNSDMISTGMTMYYDLQDSDMAWSAIPSIQYKLGENVTGFSEYVYRKQESKHRENSMNTGVKWAVKDRLQLDASVGYSFNRQNPRFSAGFGLSYLF